MERVFLFAICWALDMLRAPFHMNSQQSTVLKFDTLIRWHTDIHNFQQLMWQQKVLARSLFNSIFDTENYN